MRQPNCACQCRWTRLNCLLVASGNRDCNLTSFIFLFLGDIVTATLLYDGFLRPLHNVETLRKSKDSLEESSYFIPMTPSLDCHSTLKPLELIDTHSSTTSKIERKVELFENLSRWPNVRYAPTKDMHFTMMVVQHFFSQCLFNIQV